MTPGRFVRSHFGAYWIGACLCGSGKEGRELHDARGIYCGIVCDACEKEKRAKFRPEIFDDASYDADEPIEEEDQF